MKIKKCLSCHQLVNEWVVYPKAWVVKTLTTSGHQVNWLACFSYIPYLKKSPAPPPHRGSPTAPTASTNKCPTWWNSRRADINLKEQVGCWAKAKNWCLLHFIKYPQKKHSTLLNKQKTSKGSWNHQLVCYILLPNSLVITDLLPIQRLSLPVSNVKPWRVAPASWCFAPWVPLCDFGCWKIQSWSCSKSIYPKNHGISSHWWFGDPKEPC